jgi:hypothetical protein
LPLLEQGSDLRLQTGLQRRRRRLLLLVVVVMMMWGLLCGVICVVKQPLRRVPRP